MPYPTVTDVKTASAVPELTGASDAALAPLLSAAIQAVEEYTGQSFTAWTGTLTVPASRGRVLFLPRRLERLDVIANAGALTAADVTLAPTFDRLALNDWRASSTAYERLLRSVSGEENLDWGVAPDVTGLWGWSATPDDVATAIRFDMEDAARADANDLSSTVAAFRALGLRDASQGNLRLTIGDPSVLSPRAERMLRGFIFYGAGGELV